MKWLKKALYTIKKQEELDRLYTCWVEGVKNDGATYPLEVIRAEDDLDAAYIYASKFKAMVFFGIEVAPDRVAQSKVCVKETEGRRGHIIRYFI